MDSIFRGLSVDTITHISPNVVSSVREWLYGRRDRSYASGIAENVIVHAVNQGWHETCRRYSSIQRLLRVGMMIKQTPEMKDWEQNVYQLFGWKFILDTSEQIKSDVLNISWGYPGKYELCSVWSLITDCVIAKAISIIQEHPRRPTGDISVGSDLHRFVSQCARFPISPYVFGAVVLLPLIDELHAARNERDMPRCIGPETLLEKHAIWHYFLTKKIHYCAFPLIGAKQLPQAKTLPAACGCAFADTDEATSIITPIYESIVGTPKDTAYEITFDDPSLHQDTPFIVAHGHRQIVLLGMPPQVLSGPIIEKCEEIGIKATRRTIGLVKGRELIRRSQFRFIEDHSFHLRRVGSHSFTAEFRRRTLH